MRLTDLEVEGLRNLRAVRLVLEPGLQVVLGGNGQGKTSLLEAAYLLATGRSFRTRRLDEAIARGAARARVAGTVAGRSGQSRLEVVLEPGRRYLFVDGAEQDLPGYLGRLAVVDCSSERMAIIHGGPEERRRFIDRGVAGLKPSYLRVLGEHRRVLQQRNALLRGGERHGRTEQLDAWDERLAGVASRLQHGRSTYLEALNAVLQRVVLEAFPDLGTLRVRYRPSPSELEALRRARDSDLELGFTASGPHRDDLAIDLEGHELRRFGSAGQARAAMVALKLGKLALLQQERGEEALFLMDELDSDLDEARAASLARFIERAGFQTLVATSKDGLADGLGVAAPRIRMVEGRPQAA